MVSVETAKEHGIEVSCIVCVRCQEEFDNWAELATHLDEEHMEAVEKQELANEHDTGKVGKNDYNGPIAELCPRCEA